MQSDFDEKGVKLIKEVDNIKINHNSNLIIQSLMSICENSRDAFENNEIKKSDRYIFVKVHKVDNNIVMRFKDSGNGVKEIMLNQLFEPYTTTKHEYIGVGLSLYITYHIIVDLLGGEISVENVSYSYDNKDLKGAEFVITLPL